MSRKPPAFDDWPPQLTVTFGPWRAVVERVIDGDTVDVTVDAGFNAYRYLTIRLKDCWAPEVLRGSPEERARGVMAREFLRQLLPTGTKAVLHTFPDPQSFGRYVGHLYLADGRNVSRAMVEAGHATERRVG